MSQDNFPDWFPTTHVEHAETIRSYLVSVRGGAPFLSGADCRLVVQWLDDQVPIATILSTIDTVSDKRRKKRVRTRLSLNSCKGALNRLLGKVKNQKKYEQDASPLENWLQEISSMQVPAELLNNRTVLMGNCQKHIQNNSLSIERKAKLLIKEGLTFQEAAWQASFDEHIELQEKAELELSGLKTLLRGQAWMEAVEEVMRDQVRQRYAVVNAQRIWTALNQ